jgi:hypothetical protein
MAPPKPRDASARADFDKAAAVTVTVTDGSSVELGDSTVVSTYFKAAGG